MIGMGFLAMSWDRFMAIIDSESIVAHQMLFYVMISISGLYNLVAANVPIQSMELASSTGYYDFWIWLCLFGPLTTIVGKVLRGDYAYAGLWLQTAGDVATWFVFVSYVGATFGTADWGKGLFAGFLAIACLIGTPIFVARDVRRLRQVEAKVKRTEEVDR